MPEPLVALSDASIPAATEIPIGPNPVGSRSASSGVGILGGRLIVLLALLAIASVAVVWGLQLRAWVWNQTAAIHFFPDINNSLYWGRQALEPADHPRGFLNVYDVVAVTSHPTIDAQPDYRLDYAPLRLLVVTMWIRWLQQKDPSVLEHGVMEHVEHPAGFWNTAAPTFAPMLRFNDAMELAACAGLFFLTRHWVIRGDRRLGSTCRAGRWGAIIRPFRGSIAGLIAMLLFWFSPAVVISTHGWPTWDEWIIPFFVWAVYLACTDWWFIAGVVIAIGAMFKGQQFFVAPLFILWPLLLGRWRSAFRWIAGSVLTIAAIASPWLLTYLQSDSPARASAADRHVDWAALALVIAIAVCLVAAPIVWQAWRKRRGLERRANLLTVPLYRIGACLCLGLAVLACGGYFRGSYNWLVIGWGFGLRHYPSMTVGFSDNLAGILQGRFGWRQVTDVVYRFDPYPLRLWPTHRMILSDPTEITIRIVLITLYCIALLACILGMAIQSRRNDPNFLIAMTGAWLMFFTLMPQIHERYLLYAAGIGCSLVACGVGMTLLNVFLTLLTAVMTMHVMLSDAGRWGRLPQFGSSLSNTFGDSCLRFCATTNPDAGWAVMLAAAIFLYCSLARSPVWTAWQSSWQPMEVPPQFPVVQAPDFIEMTSSELDAGPSPALEPAKPVESSTDSPPELMI